MDPFDIFDKIAKNKNKILLNYRNLIHKEYLNKRKKVLEVLKNFSIIQNFDEETYFQTIFYTDKCILSNNFCSLFDKNNLNFFSEFLLYFKKNDIIDYDCLFIAILLGCFSLASKIIFLFLFLYFLFPFFFILII